MSDPHAEFVKAFNTEQRTVAAEKEVLVAPEGWVEHPLTEREVEIICLVARDFTARKIAHALSISVKTVDRHKANIMKKLGVRSQVAMTLYAIRNGLVEA